jgi:hypothetical protein
MKIAVCSSASGLMEEEMSKAMHEIGIAEDLQRRGI